MISKGNEMKQLKFYGDTPRFNRLSYLLNRKSVTKTFIVHQTDRCDELPLVFLKTTYQDMMLKMSAEELDTDKEGKRPCKLLSKQTKTWSTC